MHNQSISTRKNVELAGRWKPCKKAYTPEYQKLGELSAINYYLFQKRRYSAIMSDERRQFLKNQRNMRKFTKALFPFIMEKYNERINQNY